jgi:serine/threonine protein phosphatase PrpC
MTSVSTKFNKHLKVSATCEKGNVRESMEDKFLIHDFSYNDQHYYIFAIMDGHGGSEVVDKTHKNFAKTFKKCLSSFPCKKNHHTYINICITQTFEILNNDARSTDWAGTTLSLFLIVEDSKSGNVDKYVANVGDSTVFGVDIKQNKVRKLSFDHNPTVKSEIKRLECYDNYQTFDGSYVLFDKDGSKTDNIGLAMTRAIGDCSMGDSISCKPVITRINKKYDLIMLASDGIWDVWNGKGKPVWDKLRNDILKSKNSWKNSAFKFNTWRNENFEQHDNTSLILLYLDY